MKNLANTAMEKLIGDANIRTARIIKHVAYSYVIKGYSILIQFMLVPITLDYLDKYTYGIWLTMNSIMNWVGFFDIGVGNGLRNKLAEALALKDNELARTYVTTSYGVVGLIFTGLFLLFMVINPYIDWYSLLSLDRNTVSGIDQIFLFVFAFFCFRFIFKLIGNILLADQRPAVNNLIQPLANTFSFIGILLLTKFATSSLFWVAFLFAGTPLVVLVIYNLFFFGGRYKFIAPSLPYFNISYSKDLFNLGVQFLVIQIAALILFSTANVILSNVYGPEEVTVYMIGFKYFTITQMLFAIMVKPYWSAITEAYTLKDFDWIRRSISKLNQIAMWFIALTVVLFIIADFVYQIWIGNKVQIPMTMNIVLCLYVINALIGAPAHIFIQGTGKIRLQLYSAVFSIVFTIPLALLFTKVWDIGPHGVVLAILATTIPATILWRIQYHKLINNTATGIWDK